MSTLNDVLKSDDASHHQMFATCTREMTRKIVYENKSSTNGTDNYGKRLRILHFNDVYNIEESKMEPKAGASRFLTALKMFQAEEPCLVLFSGDAFSPSSLSLIVKGKQMVPVLNEFGIAAACIGNHDFDFGVENLIELIKETNFPWLMSNVVDSETKKPLALANTKHVIDFNGLKIGVMGLIEQEWIETLSTLDFDDVIYESFIETGERLAKELREVDKADYVIALTHMRQPNDLLLANEVDGIDIVLGGHDHHYECEKINEKWVVKSGTDFRDLSLIEMAIDKHSQKSLVNKIEHYTIDSKVKENEELKKIVDFYLSKGEQGLDKVLTRINCDLDGRFTMVRTRETNLGNFICDIILEAVNADCAIINSGTLRSDCITPAGNFTVGDLKKIIPYPDPIVLLACNGKILHQVLENSVSQYPKSEGRFPQVAGIKFAFDPSKPSGQRIDPRLVKIQNELLDFEKEYKLATKMYLKEGKDGYQMLVDCQALIDEEEGPLLFAIVENHFANVEMISNKKMKLPTSHRPSLVAHYVKENLIKDILLSDMIAGVSGENSPNFSSDEIEEHVTDLRNFSVQTSNILSPPNSSRYNNRHSKSPVYKERKLSLQQSLNLSQECLQRIKKSDTYIKLINEYEKKSLLLCPVVEDRIVCIKNQKEFDELLEKA